MHKKYIYWILIRLIKPLVLHKNFVTFLIWIQFDEILLEILEENGLCLWYFPEIFSFKLSNIKNANNFNYLNKIDRKGSSFSSVILSLSVTAISVIYPFNSIDFFGSSRKHCGNHFKEISQNKGSWFWHLAQWSLCLCFPNILCDFAKSFCQNSM